MIQVHGMDGDKQWKAAFPLCVQCTHTISCTKKRRDIKQKKKISQTIGNRMEFSIKGNSISKGGEPTKLNFFSQLFWDQNVVEKVKTACMSKLVGNNELCRRL